MQSGGREWGPFDARPLSEPVPIAGNMIYAYGPEWVDFGVSRLATRDTYVEFEAHCIRRPIED